MLYMSSLIVVKIKSIISGWLRLKRLISAGFILSALLLSFSHSLHGILSTLYLMFKKKEFQQEEFCFTVNIQSHFSPFQSELTLNLCTVCQNAELLQPDWLIINLY